MSHCDASLSGQSTPEKFLIHKESLPAMQTPSSCEAKDELDPLDPFLMTVDQLGPENPLVALFPPKSVSLFSLISLVDLVACQTLVSNTGERFACSQRVNFALVLLASPELKFSPRTFASSAPSGIVPQLVKQFDLSVLVATLTISLFVTGYCFGPLLWGPLSEQVCAHLLCSFRLSSSLISMAGDPSSSAPFLLIPYVCLAISESTADRRHSTILGFSNWLCPRQKYYLYTCLPVSRRHLCCRSDDKLWVPLLS
jgi:hypothetical protein